MSDLRADEFGGDNFVEQFERVVSEPDVPEQEAGQKQPFGARNVDARICRTICRVGSGRPSSAASAASPNSRSTGVESTGAPRRRAPSFQDITTLQEDQASDIRCGGVVVSRQALGFLQQELGVLHAGANRRIHLSRACVGRKRCLEERLAPRHAGSLDGFLTGLATVWQQGEVRPTHRLRPKPARDWRTRPDPFEATWPRVRAWLEAEPDSIWKALFARLQAEHPDVFPNGQLRTFQRRVKEWRHAAARRLVFASSPDAA